MDSRYRLTDAGKITLVTFLGMVGSISCGVAASRFDQGWASFGVGAGIVVLVLVASSIIQIRKTREQVKQIGIEEALRAREKDIAHQRESIESLQKDLVGLKDQLSAYHELASSEASLGTAYNNLEKTMIEVGNLEGVASLLTLKRSRK
ncbi:MAG: hypothetical protein KF691_13110 [Phycisphaeraceae bacterium]|nr:hypothetical protein [Phycisphaeraceae bacterium]